MNEDSYAVKYSENVARIISCEINNRVAGGRDSLTKDLRIYSQTDVAQEKANMPRSGKEQQYTYEIPTYKSIYDVDPNSSAPSNTVISDYKSIYD